MESNDLMSADNGNTHKTDKILPYTTIRISPKVQFSAVIFIIISCALLIFFLLILIIQGIMPKKGNGPRSAALILDQNPKPSLFPLADKSITISGPDFLDIGDSGLWKIKVPKELEKEAEDLEYAADFDSGIFDPTMKTVTGFGEKTEFTHLYRTKGEYVAIFYARNKITKDRYPKLIDHIKRVRVGQEISPKN